ncbi:MAG: hypothetical protein WBX27_02565 [Specibacter sp.]
MNLSDPRARDESQLPAPRRWAVGAAALGGGLGTGLLGTSLHGHAVYGNGYVLPVGAVAALVMLAAVELFVSLWSRNAWMVVVTGGAAYLCTGLLSIQLGAYGMISANLQGTVWLYGIAVVTPLVGWWAVRILRKTK